MKRFTDFNKAVDEFNSSGGAMIHDTSVHPNIYGVADYGKISSDYGRPEITTIKALVAGGMKSDDIVQYMLEWEA